MNRLATLLHCPRDCVPLIMFRWMLLLGVWGMVAWDWFTGAGFSTGTAIALLYATLYLAVWTMRLPALAQRGPGSWALLWVDLVLSLTPVWLAGRHGDAFIPFVYGALILPGALWGWAGVGLAFAMYVSATILQRAFYLPFDELWHPRLIWSYLAAVVAAGIWPLAVALQLRWPLRQIRAVPILPVGQHGASAAAALLEPIEPSFTAQLLPDLTSGRRAYESAQPATLERRVTRLHAAVRQVVDEAQQHGLEVTLAIEGRDMQLPPGYISLVIKAMDVALDNVRRHAGTTRVRVQLVNTPTLLHLAVRDHGSGLLDGTADRPGFHHLKLLRYRLAELGGSLAITEPEDGGLLFALSLPLQP